MKHCNLLSRIKRLWACENVMSFRCSVFHKGDINTVSILFSIRIPDRLHYCSRCCRYWKAHLITILFHRCVLSSSSLMFVILLIQKTAMRNNFSPGLKNGEVENSIFYCSIWVFYLFVCFGSLLWLFFVAVGGFFGLHPGTLTEIIEHNNLPH